MSEEFQRFAKQAGIELPLILRELYRDGRTSYGPDWPSNWRQRMLDDPPALISVCDFEWNTGDDIATAINSWLDPVYQGGRRFFPFGQSGAGDQYCLMPLEDDSIGVALIWHDAEHSKIGYSSFEDFVYSKLITAMADLSHLNEDGFSASEAQQCVLADIESTGRYLSPAMRGRLQAISHSTLENRPYQYGPKSRPQMVASMISQADEECEVEQFSIGESPTFPIAARWTIR